MARRVYAKRYARAVFEIALERNELDGWQSDLRQVAVLASDASLIAFLESPKAGSDVKTRLLSERFGDVNPLVLNLVHLLLARGRLGMLGEIADEYQRLLDSHRGVERAEVTTAVPLDDRDREELGKQLGAILGKKVVVESEVDPGVIGGITARIGGKLLDGSTRSRLLALRRELASGGR